MVYSRHIPAKGLIMQGEKGSERRGKPRIKIFQPAEMKTASEVTRVHLLNLSATGALVHLRPPPPVGAFVQIDCGTDPRPARVAWCKDSHFGVVFVTPLADEQVSEIIAEQRALVTGAAERIGTVG